MAERYPSRQVHLKTRNRDFLGRGPGAASLETPRRKFRETGPCVLPKTGLAPAVRRDVWSSNRGAARDCCSNMAPGGAASLLKALDVDAMAQWRSRVCGIWRATPGERIEGAGSQKKTMLVEREEEGKLKSFTGLSSGIKRRKLIYWVTKIRLLGGTPWCFPAPSHLFFIPPLRLLSYWPTLLALHLRTTRTPTMPPRHPTAASCQGYDRAWPG